MPPDVVLAIGIVLVVTVTAFVVSAAIGLVMGRCGQGEPDDTQAAQPVAPGRRPWG